MYLSAEKYEYRRQAIRGFTFNGVGVICKVQKQQSHRNLIDRVEGLVFMKQVPDQIFDQVLYRRMSWT